MGDDDGDGDDDDDGDGYVNQRRRPVYDPDEERHLRAYLQYKAQRQGGKVLRAAQGVGEQVADGVAGVASAVTGNGNAKDKNGPAPASPGPTSTHSKDGDSSHHTTIAGGVASLFRLIGTIARLSWLSAKLAVRYTIHAATAAWNTASYAIRVAWSIFLSVWATIKYVIRQTLRPVRVAAAPIIYIYLGTKLVFWDIPMHYAKAFLRETYPLYVFTGAALSLGTLIGVGSAVALWLGAHVFNGSSPFESSLTKWGTNEVMEWRRPSKPSAQREETIRESLNRADLPDYLRGLGSDWRPMGKSQLRSSMSGRTSAALSSNAKGKRRAKASDKTFSKSHPATTILSDAPSVIISPEEDEDLIQPRGSGSTADNHFDDYFSVPVPSSSTHRQSSAMAGHHNPLSYPRSLPGSNTSSASATPSPTLYRSSLVSGGTDLSARNSKSYPPMNTSASSPSDNTLAASSSSSGMLGPIGATGRRSRRRHGRGGEREEDEIAASTGIGGGGGHDPAGSLRHRGGGYGTANSLLQPYPSSQSSPLLLPELHIASPAAGGFSSHQLHTIAAGGSDIASSASPATSPSESSSRTSDTSSSPDRAASTP